MLSEPNHIWLRPTPIQSSDTSPVDLCLMSESMCRAKIKEKFVLMSEPDHIWLRPMPNLMKARRPAAFPFFYIGEDFLAAMSNYVSHFGCRRCPTS